MLNSAWLARRASAKERKFFDDGYYMLTYFDVCAPHFDRFNHFMAHGWREGRNPSAEFVTLFYRDSHLNGRPINPLTHYIKEGLKSRLPTKPRSENDYIAVQHPVCRPYFSALHYRTQVGTLTGDLLTHYLRIGWRENRSPFEGFPIERYTSEHLFVKGLGISPLYHFASQARLLGRESEPGKLKHFLRSSIGALKPSDVAHIRKAVSREFNAQYYLERNDDVLSAKTDPLDHFINYGWRENRMPNPFFDCAYYTEANPDVAAEGINPFYHYLTVGRAKGLRPNPIGEKLYPKMQAPAAADWDGVHPAADIHIAECIVIMPVYKGYDETLGAIHAILAERQKTRFALHVINDQSPDRALAENSRRACRAPPVFPRGERRQSWFRQICQQRFTPLRG